MLSIGIVGLPNVGKSTLFNALTKKGVPAENFPFCTIDKEHGIVSVPDSRLDKLNIFSSSKKKINTAIEFVDIAGLVSGAHKGEGLGNQFLSHIGETDAIVQVVRTFCDGSVTHVAGEIDPIKDINTIGLELILSDLSIVLKRISSNEKDIKRGDKNAKILEEALIKIRKELEEESFAVNTKLTKDEEKEIKNINLLTKKPMLYVLNKNSTGKNIDEGNDSYDRTMEYFKKNNLPYVVVDAEIESQLSKIDENQRSDFRRELSILHDGIDNLIKTSYSLLDLITFFTTGPEESRAWTIKKGSTAPIAGASIHSDFCEKFIRADVISWDKLIDADSWNTARDKGLVRTEGRDYIVCDGDVFYFRI